MAATVKLVTINFWGNEPPLERRLELAARQLIPLDPDLVAMQEVRPLDGRHGESTADRLAAALGFDHSVYERSLEWNDDDFFPGHPGGQEGLAILSRFPILEHRRTDLPEARPTEKRILLSASVATPAGPVWCHTTHLHYRLADGLAREHQVLAIDEVIRSIDSKRPQLLCGDFNATPDHDEVRFLCGLTTLAGRRTHYQDAYARVHPDRSGLTWSSENEQTRPLRSLDIDRRIDFIFVTTRMKDGRGTVVDADLALTERDDGVCASDHYGVMAVVQLEAG